MPPALLNESNIRMLSGLSFAFRVRGGNSGGGTPLSRGEWESALSRRIAGRNAGVTTGRAPPGDLQAPFYAFCIGLLIADVASRAAFAAHRDSSSILQSGQRLIFHSRFLSETVFNLSMNEPILFPPTLSFRFFSLISLSFFFFFIGFFLLLDAVI